MRKITPLSELPLSNDFMFGEIMSREEIAKLFLEDLLQQKIARLEYVNKQEMIEDGTIFHGVRLDIYLKDAENTVYDVEIQTTNQRDLERRSRYYQQKIDARTLRKGTNYKNLPDSYVIFVCTFDYFNRGLALYRKKSVIEDCPDVEYNDGSHVIFLNSEFTANNASHPIGEFLKFIKTNDSSAPYESELVKKVVSAVNEVRGDADKEGSYMTWAMKVEEIRAEARAEALKEGQLLTLKKIMKSAGWSAQKALDMFGVPEAEREDYLKALENADIS